MSQREFEDVDAWRSWLDVWNVESGFESHGAGARREDPVLEHCNGDVEPGRDNV